MLDKERPDGGEAAFQLLKADFDRQVEKFKSYATYVGEKLSNLFRFCEEVFPDGQELLILVTELTVSSYGAHFISHYGCKEYFAHNRYERSSGRLYGSNGNVYDG